jgi:small multidrug resistance family-3 protein
MKTFALYSVTALAEIFGCYAFYLTIRLGKPLWWITPGMASLAVFAWLLTLHPMEGAGRVYAAYGGVYIAASLVWLWLIEKQTPDRWDLIGAVLWLAGAAVIYFGPALWSIGRFRRESGSLRPFPRWTTPDSKPTWPGPPHPPVKAPFTVTTHFGPYQTQRLHSDWKALWCRSHP